MSDQPVRMTIKNCRAAVSASAESVNYILVTVDVPARANLGEVHGEMMLVLDRSGSMYEPAGRSRRLPIDEVVDATKAVIDALRPMDRLGIVAFDDRAELICPLTSGEGRGRLTESLEQLKAEGGGGTNMRPGLEKAMMHLNSNARDPRAARLVVLTDGQAGDEPQTLSYVNSLERQSIAALGFGKFNFEFMNQVCAPSKGLCEDVSDDIEKIKDVFMSELKVAQNTVASNLRLRIRPSEFVRLRKAYIVHPNATFLGKVQLGRQREFSFDLPGLDRTEGVQALFDLVHIPRDPGRYTVADVSVVYDVPSLSLRDQVLSAPIEVEYTTDPRKVKDVDRFVEAAQERVYAEELRVEYEARKASGDEAGAQEALARMELSPDQAIAAGARQTRIKGETPEARNKLQRITRQKR